MLKRSYVKSLILLFTALLLSTNIFGIGFSRISLERALKKAKQENKLLLLYFTADWCGYCKSMENEVFKNDTITQITKRNFIAIKIDVDAFSSSKLKKEFAIKPVPAFVILDSERKILNRSVGYLAVAKFLEFLQLRNTESIAEKKLISYKENHLRIRPGISVGIGLTNISGRREPSRFGLNTGLLLDFEISRFFFRPRLAYTSLGSKNTKLPYLQTQIDMGVIAKRMTMFGLKGGLKVFSAPYYSYLLKNVSNNLKNIDLGIRYGAVMFIGSPPQSSLELSIMRTNGLVNLNPLPGNAQQNQGFEMSLALIIGK